MENVMVNKNAGQHDQQIQIFAKLKHMPKEI